MSFRVVAIDAGSAEQFTAYAIEHGPEHDDSWVAPEDLAAFDPAAEPSALAFDDLGLAVGAASLMLRGYSAEGMARFRILHATDPAAYGGLVASVVDRAPEAVEQCYLFAPEDPAIARVLLELGFAESRRAHILRREGPPPQVPPPPPDLRIAVADPERDAEAWATVANRAFAGFPGRYDMTPEGARELLASQRVLPGGALIAWRHRTPLGVVLAASELDEEGTPLGTVDTLAIVPSAQGAGLGRLLLRAALAVADDAGFERVDLSTDVLNDRALALYRSEGFDVIDVRVCWTLWRRP